MGFAEPVIGRAFAGPVGSNQPDGQITSALKTPANLLIFLIFAILVDSGCKSPAYCGHPVPQEGTSAVVTDVGTGRDGRRLRADEPRGRRTAKSCGPDARIAGVKSLGG
jgi:hypothetical protein